MPHQQYLLAAFKQRIADSLHDYADQAERDRTVDPLDADLDVLRGVRFAAELVAGRIHNPHAADCACPCDKPDPALLPARPATSQDVAALAELVSAAGVGQEMATAAAEAVLAAGYRKVPTSLPPGPAHQPRVIEPAEWQVQLPGYLQPDSGRFVVRVPCRRCNLWHTEPVGAVMAGDRVQMLMSCAELVSGAKGRELEPEPATVVVQAARFNRTWHRGGRVTRAYWSLLGR